MPKNYNYNEKKFLDRIKYLENEIRQLKSRKKYGLVWEDKPEQVVLDCQNKVPVLKEVKNKAITTDKNKPVNILIEGDNYHSLSVLNYTHKGKIDVIYIDPPYNTGNKDFTYNDHFIDRENSFRHSKWLSFMSKRLRLAKGLLKNDGIIFISIDDNEQARLKLLCDEIFGEGNFINNIIWQRASGGGNAKGIVTGHDYILVYQRNFPIKNFLGDKVDPKRFGKDKIVERNGNKFFINDDIVRKVFGKYEEGVERRCYFEELGKYKNDKQIKEIKDKIEDKEYFLLEQNNGKNFIARLDPLDSRKKMYSIIQGVLNNLGANEMNNLGIKFSYPKPTLLLKKIIYSVSKKNDLILDFMAGSGTAGHAVLDLNKKDGGNRKFILCTNNENKICEDVCYPRIKKVINGYKNLKGDEVNGLGGNLKYYKTDLVDVEKVNNVSDANKIKLTYQTGEMIALRENTLEEKEKNNWWQIFTDGKKYTAIYFKEDKSKLKNLIEKLEKINHKIVLYIFSWSKNEYKNEFIEYKNIRVEDIPEPIIEVYKEINKL